MKDVSKCRSLHNKPTRPHITNLFAYKKFSTTFQKKIHLNLILMSTT